MRRLVLATLLLLAPLAARAQEGAALVADRLLVTAEERLVAEGNVQAFFEGTTLSAARVTYDRRADRLLIEGPILIRDPDGTVLTAERAELDPRLEQGLLRGARLVLDRRLQVAANRVDRLEGITALTGAAATACQVCPGRAPLWEIRAAQVIRDEAAQTLTFEEASFLVRGVPILWLPRLSLPEPGNDRATGVLLPRLRSSGRLGLGVELPYFIVLGDSRDLTLLPYLSTETATLGFRYREALMNGDLAVGGAVSRDGLRPGETRGYLAAEGRFRLADGLRLAFDVGLVSDGDYLDDYGLLDTGLLESRLRLLRVGDGSILEGSLSFVRSLDGTEAPDAFGGLSWERRSPLGAGTLTWGASADAALWDEGPGDLARAGAFAGWQGDRVLGPGLLLEGEGRLALDAFRTGDGDALLRVVPVAAVTLRWPLVRRRGEVADLLEPVTSLGWSGVLGEEPPVVDSLLPEWDEANLHALSRRPGEDAAEEGAHLSLGLTWTREAPGLSSRLSLGRLLWSEPSGYGPASGLAGTVSDWLVAGQLSLDAGLTLGARALLADDLALGKAEGFLAWEGDGMSVEAAYVRLPADLSEGRAEAAEEIALFSELRPSERWTVRTEARYDLAEDRAERLGFGVTWRNECVEVDLSLARRYTSPGEAPSTDFGLSIDLLGFSTGPAVEPGACRE